MFTQRALPVISIIASWQLVHLCERKYLKPLSQAWKSWKDNDLGINALIQPFIVKIRNICNLIGCDSVLIFKNFIFCRASISGIWNARKLGNKSMPCKFRQCFNQLNVSHGIYYCQSFAKSIFDVIHVNVVKSTT